MAKGRGFCFTINNPGDGDRPNLESFPFTVDYLVWQIERGEEGTTHIQGYLYVKNKASFGQIKSALPRAHIEAAQGTAVQNRVYCTKEQGRLEGPFEFGTIPSQGKRNDLKDFVELVKTSGRPSERTLIEECTSITARYPKFVDRVIRQYEAPRTWVMDVRVYYGHPDTGKTQRAASESGDAYWYSGGGWFDGYTGQQTVIFDDFLGQDSGISYNLWLRLCDRYDLSVPIKGGFARFTSKIIIFTSNVRWDQWYEKYNYDAMKRRITTCLNFCADGSTLVEIGQ
jgi:Putative viral replication protein./RNA helicase.